MDLRTVRRDGIGPARPCVTMQVGPNEWEMVDPALKVLAGGLARGIGDGQSLMLVDNEHIGHGQKFGYGGAFLDGRHRRKIPATLTPARRARAATSRLSAMGTSIWSTRTEALDSRLPVGHPSAMPYSRRWQP